MPCPTRAPLWLRLSSRWLETSLGVETYFNNNPYVTCSF